MLERLKAALVDSYVGVIALGYLFAFAVIRFVGVFIEPVAHWITQRKYLEMSQSSLGSGPPSFPFQLALTNLLTAIFLLLIAYGLLRWLYYPAAAKQDREEDSAPEPEA
jgi:small-conductance mechanosensitive channel